MRDPIGCPAGHAIDVDQCGGFVRYVSHMGGDASIVAAARVSYGQPSKGPEADRKLLEYLFTHKHTSPFEMCKIVYNIRMPIFVQRQFIRHRMQNFNEISARYTELPYGFFLPAVWRGQDTKNKQSSMPTDLIDQTECRLDVTRAYDAAYACYRRLIKQGVAREQARMVLPVGIYTEFYTCWDLNNLLKYFRLRDDEHAQSEHRDYAAAMKTIAEAWFPETMDLYTRSL